ncbi:MAG: hypothetical protein H0X62_02055 [Bacteroidetes bacterium]|nr:hypothetical protein [Bacteroidota bacterium]
MGKIIPTAFLAILSSLAVSGCKEGRFQENESRAVTVLSKELEDAPKANAHYYMVEKKEAFQSAEGLILKLENAKDSLLHLPVKERDVNSYQMLNVIIDKQVFLIKSLNEAKKAGPQEWEFHHQKLKIIFNEINKLLTSATKGNKHE